MLNYNCFMNISTYLTVLLGLVAVVGDYIVSRSRNPFLQALFDNTTHSVIGGLSWLLVCLRYKNNDSWYMLLEVAVCSFIASVIDLDHFLMAKSMRLKDATNLKQRPPLHCSTFPLITCMMLLMLSYMLKLPSVKRSTLIILTAFASHHTRDATRRGFWFYLYGSTPPLPYRIYVFTTCLIPHLISFLYEYVNINSSSANALDKLSVI